MAVSLFLSRVFLSLCFMSIAHSELFTSVYDLEKSVKLFKDNSHELKETLKSFVHKQMARLDRAEKYLQTIKDVTGDELKDPEFKITHPLNAYRFIRNQSVVAAPALSKLVEELEGFENDTQETLNSSSIQNLLGDLPTNEDLNGSVSALVRIQHYYNYTATEIADGALSSDSQVKLSASECTDISVLCQLQGMYSYGREWMVEASARAKQEKFSKLEVQAIGRKVAAAAYKTGNFYAANFLRSKRQPIRNRKTRLLDKWVKIMIQDFKESRSPGRNQHMKKLSNTKRLPDTPLNMVSSLCTHWQSGKGQDTGLSCRYEDNGHHYLKIQPMKYEDISRTPYMAVIHNAFGDHLIEDLKNMAKEGLRRSKVGSSAAEKQQVTEMRISKSFHGESMPEPKLRHLVEAITKFRPTGEPIQVANYGLGGYYTVHKDPLTGNANQRIATFMVYLSEFEGGSTVFPNAGIAIQPEKGKGVLWHNLEGDMVNYDGNVFHSACPVIKGDKWVTTFWIRQHGHEFTFPCPLTPPDNVNNVRG